MALQESLVLLDGKSSVTVETSRDQLESFACHGWITQVGLRPKMWSLEAPAWRRKYGTNRVMNVLLRDGTSFTITK